MPCLALGFELDPGTGYFYNKDTTQYFESATGLYYTFKDGQCYFFDNNSQQYAPCCGIGNPRAPVVGSPLNDTCPGPALVSCCTSMAEEPTLAVPKAKKKTKGGPLGVKKASQDIAAWAQAGGDPSQPVQQGQPFSGAAPGSAVAMESFNFEIKNFNPDPPKKAKKKPAAAVVAPQTAQFDPRNLPTGPNDNTQRGVFEKSNKSDAASFLDKLDSPSKPAAAPAKDAKGFVCYLCNRKFNSQEMLTKHENKSDLHKKNLALATMKEKKRN